MKFQHLQSRLKIYPLFTIEDVFKWFPQSGRKTTINQLSRWVTYGYLDQIKRGVYLLKDYEVRDSFVIANFIYSPSYISLESALNSYSIIPDIPFTISSVTLRKTTRFKTKRFGRFTFNHIKPELFFGFESIRVEQYSYSLAFPEKALFDFLYLKSSLIPLEGFPEEARFSFEKEFRWNTFKEYSKLIPLQNKKFHTLAKRVIDFYA